MSTTAALPTEAAHGAADGLGAAKASMAALAIRDYAGLDACLAPEVRFRALTPNHVWGSFGAGPAIAALRNWFDDAECVAFLATRVGRVGGRLHLAYRLLAWNGGEATVCEQQASCAVTGARITDICIICSGFRPPAPEDLAR